MTKNSGRITAPRITDNEKKRISYLFKEGLSPRKIGDTIGRSRSGVLKFLVKSGQLVQEHGVKVKRFSSTEDALLRDYYPTRGANWCSIRLGRDAGTVRCRAKKIGVKLLRKNLTHVKLSESQVEKATSLYALKYKCAAEIGLLFGVKPDCVYSHLRANGVEMRKGAFGARKRIPWVDNAGRLFRMRSTWEIATAHWFDQNGRKWDYEREAYTVNLPNGKTSKYTPDFWVYDGRGALELVVDVKGSVRPSQMEKIQLLLIQQPSLPLVIWCYDELVARKILRGPREAPPMLFDSLKKEAAHG